LVNEDDRKDINDNSKTIRLGLRPNINQFLILVLVNAFVGAFARNEGIMASKGKYFCNFDSDARFNSNKGLEWMMEPLPK
jgi:hypothetical protein